MKPIIPKTLPSPVADAVGTSACVHAGDAYLPLPCSLGRLRPLFLAVATLSIATLAGCGGGGGGGAPAAAPSPPASSPAPAPSSWSGPVAPQMTVPDPVGYDADHLAAFNRVNELRLAAGLGMMAQNADIDKASQAHAQWNFDNDTLAHVETPGTPGFTEATYSERMISQGYPLKYGGEVLSEGYSPSDGVDALFNGIYHRQALMSFRPVDMGVGWVPGRIDLLGAILDVDYGWPDDGTPRSNGQSGQVIIDGAAIWPLDGATSVPLTNGSESPNPVPTTPVTYLGTAASIEVDSNYSIEINSFSMTRVSDGVVVGVVLLDDSSDPNQLIGSYFVAIIPVSALEPETQYSVSFDGALVEDYVGIRRPYARTWVFTTGKNSVP